MAELRRSLVHIGLAAWIALVSVNLATESSAAFCLWTITLHIGSRYLAAAKPNG